MFWGDSSCLSWQLCPHMPLRSTRRVTLGTDHGELVVPKVKATVNFCTHPMLFQLEPLKTEF